MLTQQSLVHTQLSIANTQDQDYVFVNKIGRRYPREASNPKIWSQLLQSCLLPCPRMRRDSVDMHERAEDFDITLSTTGTVSWAEQQRKSLEIRRFVQFIFLTVDSRLASASPTFSRMFEAFRGKDVYGAAVHMDQDRFHVFLVGPEQRTEYLNLSSRGIGERVHDLIRLLATATSGHEQDAVTWSGSRKIQKSSAHAHSNHHVEDPMYQVLGILWEVPVRPIVQVLGLRSYDERVVWCPVGVLAMLPLHAAGVFEGLQDNISNYAVSSYMPILTAFCRATCLRPKGTISRGGSKSVLIIADQAKSCSYARLPHTTAEADIVRSHVASERIVKFDGDTPFKCVNFATRTTPHMELLLFACHREQERNDPRRGGRLTLDQLTRVNFPQGQLAYLCACETASVDPTCPDNGMNLATTLLFNGFRNVIGSMWSMQDIDGPFVAERVYGRICRDGRIDYYAVPWAMDETIWELRETEVPASRWATFSQAQDVAALIGGTRNHLHLFRTFN